MVQDPPASKAPSWYRQAASKLLDFDDPQYLAAHTAPLKKPRHYRYRYRDQEIELIGPRHTYDPNSSMAQLTFIYVQDYISRVPKDRRLIIVEGFVGDPTCESTLEKSVKLGGEPAGVTFLAKERGVLVISPEPHYKFEAAEFIKQGFKPEQVAVYYGLRLIPGSQENNISREEAAVIALDRAGVTPRHDLKVKTDNIVGALWTLNEIAKNELGHELVSKYNKLNLSADQVHQLLTPNKSNKASTVNHLAAASSRLRDIYLLKQIYQCLNEGKSPLVVYGASHTVKLKPAIEYLVLKQ